VLLERDTTKFCFAATWDKSYAGIVGAKYIRDIREAVKDLVDEFANDYLAVNPKREVTTKKGDKQ